MKIKDMPANATDAEAELLGEIVAKLARLLNMCKGKNAGGLLLLEMTGMVSGLMKKFLTGEIDPEGNAQEFILETRQTCYRVLRTGFNAIPKECFGDEQKTKASE